MYILYIQIFLPTALFYWFFKLMKEIFNYKLYSLLYLWVKILYKWIGLIIILLLSIIIYYTYLYNILNIFILFKLSILLWWLGRFINTFIYVKYCRLIFGTVLALFFVNLNNNYKNRIIGLNYYICPYFNYKDKCFPTLIINAFFSEAIRKFISKNNPYFRDTIRHICYKYKLHDQWLKVTYTSKIFMEDLSVNGEIPSNNFVCLHNKKYWNIMPYTIGNTRDSIISDRFLDILPESSAFYWVMMQNSINLGSLFYVSSEITEEDLINNINLYYIRIFFNKYNIKCTSDFRMILIDYQVSIGFT